MITARMRTAAAVALLALVAPSAIACTTFLFPDGEDLVFGRNYDWSLDRGYLIANKRDIAKTAMTSHYPAKWVSRFGSITFNQFGREFPLGGINEAGLVVEVMWLEATEYPDPGSLATVTELQWVQYQLDNFATVREVVEGLARVTVDGTAPIHYLVADATGDCAAVEFLGGEPVVHTAKGIPAQVLANSTYDESYAFLDSILGLGEDARVPDGTGSRERFARAAMLMRARPRYQHVPLVDHAFAILAGVSAGTRTKWSVVYDIPARRIWFRTLANQQLRYVDLADFECSGTTPVEMLDLNARHSGDLSPHFTDYSPEANHDLVFDVYRNLGFIGDLPDETLEAIARYPETTSHVED